MRSILPKLGGLALLLACLSACSDSNEPEAAPEITGLWRIYAQNTQRTIEYENNRTFVFDCEFNGPAPGTSTVPSTTRLTLNEDGTGTYSRDSHCWESNGTHQVTWTLDDQFLRMNTADGLEFIWSLTELTQDELVVSYEEEITEFEDNSLNNKTYQLTTFELTFER